MALTAKRTARLIARGQVGRHFAGDGLYLVIGGKGAASWSRRYQLSDRAHWFGLGSARAFDLREARERNKRVSQLLADGIDPLVQKRGQRAAQAATATRIVTFRGAAECYIRDHAPQWRSPKHLQQWHNSLARYVYPKIGNMDVAAVDLPHVLDVLEAPIKQPDGTTAKFWLARTETADRVRNRIELILNFCYARRLRTSDNVATWAALKHILPEPSRVAKPKHHAAMAYAELPALVRQLIASTDIADKALAFLILTAARTGEVIGAKCGEIDLDNGTWTVPGARMKNGKEHRVPLSAAAVELIERLLGAADAFLFTDAAGKPLKPNALLTALRRAGRTESVHGMRSAFSDWAYEHSTFSGHTIESSLAHVIGNAAERAYRRGDLLDQRRRLMESWSNYCCTSKLPSRQSGKVLQMRTTVAA